MKKLIAPIVLFVFTLLLFIITLAAPPYSNTYIVTFMVFGAIYLTILYSVRNLGPYVKKFRMWLAAIFVMGFGLYVFTENTIILVIGVFSPLLFIAWINFFRFPPYLWKFVWLLRANRQAEAAQYINEWIRSHPNDWKALIMRSDMYLSRSQFVEAERDTRLATSINSKAHEAYNQLGRSLMAQGLYAEARQVFEIAQNLKPNALYLYNIAATQYRLGNFSKAVELLTKITASPLDFQIFNLLAYYYLGKGLEAIGNQEKARAAFQKMNSYAMDLTQSIEHFNKLPDHVETIAVREDLADIQRLIALGAQQTK